MTGKIRTYIILALLLLCQNIMARKYGRDTLILAVLAYNVGPYKMLGNRKFPKSRLLQKIERGLRNIEKDYLDFCRWKGKHIASIKRRRQIELLLLY